MTAAPLILLPLLVAAVLIASGVLKLRQVEATMTSMAELRLPGLFHSRSFARLFPWFEIVVGAAVLLGSGVVLLLGSAAALALFVVYTVVIARALRRPEPVHCNCFGEFSSRPVSRTDLVRNILLTAAGVALAILAAGYPGVPAVLLGFDAVDGWWLAAVAIVSIIALLVARRAAPQATAAAAAEEPGAPITLESLASIRESVEGRPIPAAEVTTPDGAVVELPRLARERAQFIVFTKTHCGPCSALMPEVPGWAAGLAGSVDVRVAATGDRAEFVESYPEVAEFALYGVASAREKLGVKVVPAAVLLGLDGTVTAGPAFGAEQIEGLHAAVLAAVAEATAAN